MIQVAGRPLIACLVVLVFTAFAAFVILISCNKFIQGSLYKDATSEVAFPFYDTALHTAALDHPSPGREKQWPTAVWVLWGLPFLSALLSFAWRGLPKQKDVLRSRDHDSSEAPSGTQRVCHLAGRLLHYQLPPRRIWSWMCDGLAVYDALTVSVWVALNVLYVQQRYALLYPSFAGSLLADEDATQTLWPAPDYLQVQWALLGAGCGWACCLNLMLLLYPVPRSSFLHWLTGTSFPTLIKYHRWLGHGTMLIISLHGLGYYVVWLDQGNWTGGLSWNASNTNLLAGTLAWLCGCALWASSITWVRRNFYEVFHRMHMVFGMLFLLFALMHDIKLWTYTIPGLVLYLLDVQLRLAQRAQPIQLCSVTATSNEHLATLQLQADPRWKMQPIQELFIRAAAVSRLQWHPFTVIAGDQPNTYIAYVKACGGWTRSLISRLVKEGKVEVRVDGPYGENSERPKWAGYKVLIIFAGGIGVTPVLGMLLDIERRRQLPQGSMLCPRKVYLTYAMHYKQEAALLEKPLISKAIEDGWLEVALHYTGGHRRPKPSEGEEELALAKRFSGDSVEELTQARRGGASEGGSPVKAATAFQDGSSLRRAAILPYHYGLLHWAAAHLLCLAGAIGGACGVLKYEALQHAKATGQRRAPDWAVSLLLFVATCIGSMLVPLLVLIIPAHIARWHCRRFWPAEEGETKEEQLQQLPPGSLSSTTAPPHSSTLRERDLEYAFPDLPLQPGRPDVAAVMRRHLEQHPEATDVAVFVAGPEGMAKDVIQACTAHNDVVGLCGKPWVHATRHTYNL